ncbi:atherin-like [Lolium rigidum]|uniref:atherin-like n=1 Tax=Lolium rigidum TaxID=89674 RepID=UPI001F5DEEA7|nr:atherin-like [Lolium rigidum]
MRQQPLPLPPRMRAPTDREPAAAAGDGTARPPERRQQQLGQGRRPYRAAEGDEAPVPVRTRPPEPEPQPPRPRPATNHAAEARAALLADVARPPAQTHGAPQGRATREAPADPAVARPPERPATPEAPAAAVASPPGQQYGAREGRAAREAPVATVARPPGHPNGVPEGRAAQEVTKPPGQANGVPEGRAPTVARPPEPQPNPYYVPEGRGAAPVATTDRPPSPPTWPYPYYYEPERPRRRRRASPLTSCLLAAVFLLLAGGGAAAALFLLFRPRPPDIAVSAVRLPSFAAANGTVAFTFEQLATVRNPNRAPLAHFDSSLRIAYAGGEIGSIYIPAGLIDSGSTKHLTASFAVQAFPAATPPPTPLQMAAQQPAAAAVVMEVDSLLVVKGRVKMLGVLTHRVQASKMCRVGVSPMDGRVLGFRC